MASRLATEAEDARIKGGRWVFAEPPGTQAQRMGDARPRTLYVSRSVTNGDAIVDHYRRQGVTGLVPSDQLHVTIAFSRRPLDWMRVEAPYSDKIEIVASGPRVHEMLGASRDALVLRVSNWELVYRHEAIIRAGASWDWPEYQPHITIAYGFDGEADGVTPFTGKVTLGKEVFAEVDEDWKAKLQPRLEDRAPV